MLIDSKINDQYLLIPGNKHDKPGSVTFNDNRSKRRKILNLIQWRGQRETTPQALQIWHCKSQLTPKKNILRVYRRSEGTGHLFFISKSLRVHTDNMTSSDMLDDRLISQTMGSEFELLSLSLFSLNAMSIQDVVSHGSQHILFPHYLIIGKIGFSLCLSSFEFRVDILLNKANYPSLPCYLTHNKSFPVTSGGMR